MVFKRYIYKNGKKIGPYYYENKKVDGKVISTYLGTTLPKGKELGKPTKSRTKDFLKGKYKYLIIGGVVLLLLATLINFLFLIRLEPTGEISVTLDEPPEQGDYLSGIVKLTINKGELVPASVLYIIDNVGETSEFPLSSLLAESQVQGDFYMRGFDISGSGMGYGAIGEKITYPEVDFTMKITKIEIKQETAPLDSQPSITSKEPSITGNALAPSTESTTQEIKATVTAESPYTYELVQDEIVEIIFFSQPVNLEIKGNIATITTEYVEIEQGFGEDYVTEQEVEFSFDLENLNLPAKQGELIITLMYDDEELISTSKTITLGEEPEPVEEAPEESELEPPTLAGKGTSNLFFEDCDDVGDWPIIGVWESVLNTCRATFTKGSNMESTAIDASAPDILYSNLSFDYDNSGLDSFEYLEVYVANSISGWVLIFSTNDNNPGSVEINISEYITLDNSVQIRGSCRAGNKEFCQWDNINLTAYTSDNLPPTIDSVGPVPSKIPLEAGIRPVVFDVEVSDPNGFEDIASVAAEFRMVGETTRIGACVLAVQDVYSNGLTNRYSCTINMQYYDKDGDWEVWIEAFDTQGASDIDNLQIFTYGLLSAFVINSPAGDLNWPILNPGGSYIPSSNTPNEIENTGNSEGQVYITAYDLIGLIVSAEKIPANNFVADIETEGAECTGGLNPETQLFDSSSIPITGSTLSRASDAGISTEEIYYCITSVPFVSSQTYSATGGNSWMIEIQ